MPPSAPPFAPPAPDTALVRRADAGSAGGAGAVSAGGVTSRAEEPGLVATLRRSFAPAGR